MCLVLLNVGYVFVPEDSVRFDRVAMIFFEAQFCRSIDTGGYSGGNAHFCADV